MVMEGVVHAGCACCLYAVNLNLRTQAFDSEGYAADKSAAANRYDYCFNIWQLVQNFQADAALAGNNKLIVVWMDKGHACFFLQLYGAVMCFVVGTGNKLHLRAQALGVFYLHNRCAVRHADDAFDAHAGCSQCYALRMVAGAAGDNALACFLRCKLADFVVGTAYLETACYLQVFCFQIQVVAFA